MIRLLLALASVFLFAITPVFADATKGVTGSMIVAGSRDKVWEVLTATGHFDDTLHSVHGNEAIVTQKFKSLPFFGVTTVKVKATVQPKDRIDFRMIESDRLKAMEGNWQIHSIDKGKMRVQLTMYVDPGLPVPRFLVNQFIAGKVRHRLRTVKNLVEKPSATATVSAN